jgi:hypothetical protein
MTCSEPVWAPQDDHLSVFPGNAGESLNRPARVLERQPATNDGFAEEGEELPVRRLHP